MRKLVTALCALVFLSSCDDELKLVSRDFSVTLKSIDVGTAVVGKPVNCTLTISDLDPNKIKIEKSVLVKKDGLQKRK